MSHALVYIDLTLYAPNHKIDNVLKQMNVFLVASSTCGNELCETSHFIFGMIAIILI